MKIEIPYHPHPKQLEVHEDPTRFKVVAAGRGSGKTIMLQNEHIRQALMHPEVKGEEPKRSWYIAPTYKQAESIAWKQLFNYLPSELIASKNVNKLQVVLTTGHIMEFKGAEDPDYLRGVRLVWAGFDEYEMIRPEVWDSIVRPMLIKSRGGAMFVGTPSPEGGGHFRELYDAGRRGEEDLRSWLFYSRNNPHILCRKEDCKDADHPFEEIEKARRSMPPDIFKREFEADFNVAFGLIYDNFRLPTHTIPNYEPTQEDFVVGSIDPGLHNPTAAILCAWDRQGVGRIFKEYYEKDLLSGENAQNIFDMAKPYKVAYWVIDRASTKREPSSGFTVFGKFQEKLKPLITANNDPGTVWAGIDEVKKMLHVDPETHRPKLLFCSHLRWTFWEMSRYTRYKRKWHLEKNEEEKPRKLNDHIMDCIRNMVMTKPWSRRDMRPIILANRYY